MNQYLKGFLVVLASALAQVGVTATPIVAVRVPTAIDFWVIGLAVLVNVSTTLTGLMMQSPLPRKEWTEEDRAKLAVTPQPKGVTT